MAVAETAELAVRLSMDSSKFTGAINRIDRRLGAFSGSINRNLGRAFDSALTRGARVVTSAFTEGMQSLMDLESVNAQTAATLATDVGKRSGVTATAVRNIAGAFEDINAQVDEIDIQKVENLLLTFGITNKTLRPATQAVLDFATATGRDVQSAGQLVGRALSNPAKAAGILGRALGKLTPAEQKLLDAAVKTKGKLDDQNAIIKILEGRYAGSFARAGETAAGKFARFNDKMEDLKRTLASSLLPVVEKVADRLSNWLAKPETVTAVKKISDAIAGLFTDQNLNTFATSLETASGAVSAAITAFNNLPPDIKALAIGALTLNKVTGGAVGGAAEAFGKIISAGFKSIFATNVTVVGTNVVGGGAGAASSLLPAAGAGAAGAGAAGLGLGTATFTGLAGLAAGMALSGFIRQQSGMTDQEWEQTYQNRLIAANAPWLKPAEKPATEEAVRDSIQQFRVFERLSEDNNALQNVANAKLEAISTKPTTVNTTVNVTTATTVSVSDVTRKITSRTQTARAGNSRIIL